MNTDTKPTEFPPKPFISEANVEFAAKRACELLGWEPNIEMFTGAMIIDGETGQMRHEVQPRWKSLCADIRKQYAINIALMEAGCGMARIERSL